MEGKRKLRRKTSSPNYSDSGNGQKNVCKTVLIGDQIHRWLKVKMSNNLKSNVEVAKLLLDCYFSRSDISVETEQLSQAPPRTDPHPVISTSSSRFPRYEDGASDEIQLPFIVKMEVDLDTNEHCETQTLSLYDSDSTTTHTTYPYVSTSSDPETVMMSNKNSSDVSLNIENIKTEPCSDDESAASDNRPFPVNMIAVNRPPASSRVEDNLAAPSLEILPETVVGQLPTAVKHELSDTEMTEHHVIKSTKVKNSTRPVKPKKQDIKCAVCSKRIDPKDKKTVPSWLRAMVYQTLLINVKASDYICRVCNGWYYRKHRLMKSAQSVSLQTGPSQTSTSEIEPPLDVDITDSKSGDRYSETTHHQSPVVIKQEMMGTETAEHQQIPSTQSNQSLNPTQPKLDDYGDVSNITDYTTSDEDEFSNSTTSDIILDINGNQEIGTKIIHSTTPIINGKKAQTDRQPMPGSSGTSTNNKKDSELSGKQGTVVFSPAPNRSTSGFEMRLNRLEEQNEIMINMISSLVKKQGSENTSKSRTQKGQIINVPHNIRVAVRDAFVHAKEEGKEWTMEMDQDGKKTSIKFNNALNREMTDSMIASVKGLYPSAQYTVIKEGIKRYYTSLRDKNRRVSSGKDLKHKKSMVLYARRKRKLENRRTAVNMKECWGDDKKLQITNMLCMDMMSSEEEVDSDGETSFLIKRLPWRSKECEKVLEELDNTLNERKTTKSKRMELRRIRGDGVSNRQAPEKIKEICPWAVNR